jgi:hypothetical protein
MNDVTRIGIIDQRVCLRREVMREGAKMLKTEKLKTEISVQPPNFPTFPLSAFLI